MSAEAAGITIYRGIAGEYDPDYGSAEQAWHVDLKIAYEQALQQAQLRGSAPTVLVAFLPAERLDQGFRGGDWRYKPKDKATIHGGGGIIDVPAAVRLEVGVVPQQTLDRRFPALQALAASLHDEYGQGDEEESRWHLSLH